MLERPEKRWPCWTRGGEGTSSWRGSLETETCQMHLPDEVGEEGRRVEGRGCKVDKVRLQRDERSRLGPRGEGEKQLGSSGSFFPVPSPCPG